MEGLFPVPCKYSCCVTEMRLNTTGDKRGHTPICGPNLWTPTMCRESKTISVHEPRKCPLKDNHTFSFCKTVQWIPDFCTSSFLFRLWRLDTCSQKKNHYLRSKQLSRATDRGWNIEITLSGLRGAISSPSKLRKELRLSRVTAEGKVRLPGGWRGRQSRGWVPAGSEASRRSLLGGPRSNPHACQRMKPSSHQERVLTFLLRARTGL